MKKLLIAVALLTGIVTLASGQPTTLACKPDYAGSWYASELRKTSPDFGVLVFQLEPQKKAIQQTWGNNAKETVVLIEWSDVQIEFEQSNASSYADGALIGYRKITINRLSGNFVSWPIYKNAAGRVLNPVEVSNFIEKAGLNHPFLQPPREPDSGACEVKKQMF
jgi:hypothetical protein